MESIFKYKRVLTLVELNYYFNPDEFIKYYNGFLTTLELQLPHDFSYDFENCLNFLNSISIIVVEKFLCAYLFYIERGQNNIMDRYDYYDTSTLKRYNNQQLTVRAVRTFSPPDPQQTQPIYYSVPYTFILNKEGDCTLKDNSVWGIISKIIINKKQRREVNINPKDVVWFVKKIENSQSIKDSKEIVKEFKKIISSSTSKKYELENYRKITE